jgi:methylsterol monooxygenase
MNSYLRILLILLSFILYFQIVKYTDNNNIDYELNIFKNIWKLYVLNPIELLFKDTKYNNDIKFILMTFGTQMIHFIYFWFHCIILNIIDLYPNYFPNMRKYKIQPNKNDPIDMDKYWICIKQALFNQLFVNISFALITYPLFIYQDCSISIDNFPTLRRILLDFLIFIVIEEIGFYYCHRIMHAPLLYTKIHKQHHEWTAPISCAAIYANPIEHALCNLLPLIAGPIICGSHLFTYW